MSSPDTVAVASTLVNLSAVGFIILFGIAAFIPMVYESTIFRKRESVELAELFAVFSFPYRLITRLGDARSVFALMVISLFFIITGLLSLLYFLTDCCSFLNVALCLSVLNVVALIICISCIVLSTIYIKKDEVAKIYDYIAAAYKK